MKEFIQIEKSNVEYQILCRNINSKVIHVEVNVSCTKTVAKSKKLNQVKIVQNVILSVDEINS